MNDKMSINIETEHLTYDERIKVDRAVSHIFNAINSPEFHDFIIDFNATYYIKRKLCGKYKININNFIHNNGMTKLEIFNYIMRGKETLSNEDDNEIDIFLKIDRNNKKRVLGYTYPSTRWQWIYTSFFKRASVEQIAGNIFHEWLHKIGFKHDRKKTPRRRYSVPYALGYFVRDFKNS